jgi:hypothetical protein
MLDAPLLTIQVFKEDNGFRAAFSATGSRGERFARNNLHEASAVQAVERCLDVIRKAADRRSGTRGRFPFRYRVAKRLV